VRGDPLECRGSETPVNAAVEIDRNTATCARQKEPDRDNRDVPSADLEQIPSGNWHAVGREPARHLALFAQTARGLSPQIAEVALSGPVQPIPERQP
jgi:hypothetical protein